MSNADWRGYKAHIWEGGHRVPLIARWPSTLPANTLSDELVCLTDFMATCASIAGQDLPDDAAEDSCDMLPALLGGKSGQAPIREALVHHSGYGVFSIRQGQWKMVLDCQDSGGWPTPRGPTRSRVRRGSSMILMPIRLSSTTCGASVKTSLQTSKFC